MEKIALPATQVTIGHDVNSSGNGITSASVAESESSRHLTAFHSCDTYGVVLVGIMKMMSNSQSIIQTWGQTTTHQLNKLLVEDQSINQILMSPLFKREGHACNIAANGWARSSPIDPHQEDLNPCTAASMEKHFLKPEVNAALFMLFENCCTALDRPNRTNFSN